MTQPLQPLGGACAWHGRDLSAEQSWLRAWPDRCIDAFDKALVSAERAGIEWHQATRLRFPLDAVADDIRALADALENGPGVVKLTGLPVARYTPPQLKMLFFGLGSWLGRHLYQTAAGEAQRDDENFMFVAAWQFNGVDDEPTLHKEELEYDYVEVKQRSYK